MWSQALSRFYYIWHIFGQGAPIRGFSSLWQDEREVSWLRQNARERGLEEGEGLGIQSPAAKSYRWQGWFMRSLGLIEGDRAIISPGPQLSGSLEECWRCESRCKLTPECLLCWPTPPSPWLWPCSPSFPTSTSKSERKQSSQSPEDNRGRARPPLLSQHLYSFISFSGLLLQGVIQHPCGLFSPTPLSTFSFPLLSFLASFSPLESSLLQTNNKVNRQSREHRKPI